MAERSKGGRPRVRRKDGRMLATRESRARAREAVTSGDSESIFLDPTFVKANLPAGAPQDGRKISRMAAAAEEQRRIFEEAVAWCEIEVEAMKAAEANMNWRYTKRRMEIDEFKPKLRREYTDKRTGAVAWEALDMMS